MRKDSRIQGLAIWLPEHIAACLYDLLRMFPHLLNTAHSGARLEKNEPEATLLLCQKKFPEAVIQSAAILTALGMDTYLDDSHSRVHIFLHSIVGAEAIIQVVTANTV